MKICTNCERYVQNEEDCCPFCESSQLVVEPEGPGAARSRAGMYAARAALATVALGAAMACSDDQDGDSMTAGSDAGAGGEAGMGGSAAGAAGTMVSSAGTSSGGGDSGSGGGDLAGPDAGDPGADASPIPIYGGPFPDMTKARV